MDGGTVQLIGVGVALVGMFVAVDRAARRFASDQRRRGLWDKKGPLHPTKGPLLGRGALEERREVIGLYRPEPRPAR
ncbi:MAG: hypothetical protein ABI625_21070 [bacterium]